MSSRWLLGFVEAGLKIALRLSFLRGGRRRPGVRCDSGTSRARAAACLEATAAGVPIGRPPEGSRCGVSESGLDPIRPGHDCVVKT
jgi:hypothetical protein